MATKAEIQKLTLENMGLAYKIAWKYHGRGLEQDELQAVALFGLVKAASGFDRSREVPFPAFASTVIRNTIRMEFRRIKKDRKCVSMEESVTSSGEAENPYTWGEWLSCREEGFDRVEREGFLSSLTSLPELTGKERKAVRLVICNGLTQKEAGEQIGMSQAHVSRRVRSGMEKIRKKYMEAICPDEMFVASGYNDANSSSKINEYETIMGHVD